MLLKKQKNCIPKINVLFLHFESIKLMRKILLILSVLALFASCGVKKETSTEIKKHKRDTVKRWTFNRVLKTDDINIKFEWANKYYEMGKYSKSMEIFDQLMPYFKGQKENEIITYKYAMCNYNVGDYLFAAYLFNKYYETYPKSDLSEKALFMSAYCYFLDSPRWTLDQSETHKSIDQFGLLLNKFPISELVDSINTIVDTMVYKLEYKDFKGAELYNKMEYYKAASIALRNVIQKNPGSLFNEESFYLVVKSEYEYAKNSIRHKQRERYSAAIADAKRYLDSYPNGIYSKDVSKILNISTTKFEQLSK